MKISISSTRCNTSDRLNRHVLSRTEEMVVKYFDRAISGTIHFGRENSRYLCDIIVNDGISKHSVVKSSASCDDIYSSFDQAIAKLEKQLRKYKSKLKAHVGVKLSEIAGETSAMYYTIAPTSFSEDDEELEQTGNNPVTIAEKAVHIETLTVSDAIMYMDLQDVPALMFRNSGTKRINMVYYRKDGNIGWVDSDSDKVLKN